ISRPQNPSDFPFHLAPGLSNFRDIGGWPIASPSSPSEIVAHVRPGIVYRGSDTNRIQPTGISKLQELNIKTDFDLRSKQQIENAGGFKDMGEWGIERRWAAVFSDESYTEDAARKRYELYAGEGTEGIVEAFVDILIEGAPMIRDVLGHLRKTITSPASYSNPFPIPPPPPPPPPRAIFLHCTTGNNRTGAFISLLLLLLRVPPAIIVQEYALSEQGLAPTRHINIKRLLGKGAFKEYGSKEAKRKCERMVGAREESMRALLEEVEKRWGGAEGYFNKVLGMSCDDMEEVRQIL
ncbi:putative tyrosine-protein phosphatase, partial [Pleomassaria siparia CBS 279.74]